MAATKSGAWSALTSGSLPSGSVTINSGSNRMLIVVIMLEVGTDQTVTTFTIGGQTYDYSRDLFLEAGSSDEHLFMFVWNEASIAAMSGSTIAFAGISSGSTMDWAYATIQDTDQTGPTLTDNSSTSATSVDVTTTSTANDLIIGIMIDGSANRAPLAADTLTSRLTYNVTGHASAVFDGVGGDGTTTFSNDGTANEMAAMAAVFAEITSGNPMMMKIMQEGHLDG